MYLLVLLRRIELRTYWLRNVTINSMSI